MFFAVKGKKVAMSFQEKAMQSLGPALAEFKTDDNIKSSASSDPEILGMQLAMIQQSACGDE